MSILINLLPDVRQAKLKERQRRQLVSSVSVMIWVVCGGVLALMFAYSLGQKAVIGVNTTDISRKKQQLEAVPGLLDALTAQQHSASLPQLYGQRVFLTKFFAAYGAANPSDVTLTAMTLDSRNALVVSGFGKTYASVAKLARALEASNVAVGEGATATNSPYFTAVTITSVSNTSTRGVTFSLSATLGAGVTSGNN